MSAFAVLNFWHTNNTTYHIHSLTHHKGEEVAEAELDFSSKDRLCGLWGGAYDKNNSLRGVINNKTVPSKSKSFFSPCRSLTDPPEQASEEEWANTAPSQCVHLWKKKIQDTTSYRWHKSTFLPKTDQEKLILCKKLLYFSLIISRLNIFDYPLYVTICGSNPNAVTFLVKK